MPLNGNPCQTHATHAFMTTEERLAALEAASQGGSVSGSVSWGGIGGTLANQTDLQTALDAKGTSNFSGAYADLTGKPTLFDGNYSSLAGVPAAFTPAAHDQAISTITGLQAALDGKQAAGSYEPANANIQAHVASSHAPSNAQKNSDITKAEIEAKLIGEISSHTHAAGGADPFILKARLAANAATGANVTPISLTGFSFTYEANSTYFIDFAGATQAPAATTGSGFQLDVSTAVTRVSLNWFNQLANTGTVTGGSSIADDASVGVSSGRPSANVDTPVYGGGVLVTGANTGTAQLRYRSEVAAVSTVMAGFAMRVMKM
jgi:hypothetical protein